MDNPSLARAAIWFLVGAAGVLLANLWVVVRLPFATTFTDHSILLDVVFIALSVLFTFLAMIASVLGFLAADSRYGRAAGIGGFVLVVVGLSLAIACYVHQIRVMD